MSCGLRFRVQWVSMGEKYRDGGRRIRHFGAWCITAWDFKDFGFHSPEMPQASLP